MNIAADATRLFDSIKKLTFHLPASFIAKQLLLLLASQQGWKTTYM
jgi:hypothetical protein